MNLWGHPFSQNANMNTAWFLPYPVINFQGRNSSNFWLAFWEKRWAHKVLMTRHHINSQNITGCKMRILLQCTTYPFGPTHRHIFDLPERRFEPQIFSNFPAHGLNFHVKWGAWNQIKQASKINRALHTHKKKKCFYSYLKVMSIFLLYIIFIWTPSWKNENTKKVFSTYQQSKSVLQSSFWKKSCDYKTRRKFSTYATKRVTGRS